MPGLHAIDGQHLGQWDLTKSAPVISSAGREAMDSRAAPFSMRSLRWLMSTAYTKSCDGRSQLYRTHGMQQMTCHCILMIFRASSPYGAARCSKAEQLHLQPQIQH